MNILVGVDLSDSTDKVIRKAEEIAKALSSKLWIIHAAEPEPDFVGYETGPQSVRDNVSKAHHEEHRQIQDFAARMRDDGLDASALLIQGATVEVLLQEAERLDARMVVLGSHGRGAMYHLLVGSVSAGVLKKTRCPVLIVPTHTETG